MMILSRNSLLLEHDTMRDRYSVTGSLCMMILTGTGCYWNMIP